MFLSAKQLLLIEEEIIDSMTTTGAKALIRDAYNQYRDGLINHKRLYLRIKLCVINSKSKFQIMDDMIELADKKEYYIKNEHIYGDYNENKIQNI